MTPGSLPYVFSNGNYPKLIWFTCNHSKHMVDAYLPYFLVKMWVLCFASQVLWCFQGWLWSVIMFLKRPVGGDVFKNDKTSSNIHKNVSIGIHVVCSSYLVVCTMMHQPHPWTHWWIESGVNTCMDDWSSWYITYQPRQQKEVCQCSSINAGPTLECYVASMDVIPLFDCLCNGLSTSPMHSQINWEGCQHMCGWLEKCEQ